MKKNKIYYIGLNLIAPGIGQFALGKWIRGTIMLLGTIALFIWLLCLFFFPLYHTIITLLSEDNKIELAQFNYIGLLISFGGIILAYTWSIIDIFFIKLPDDTEKETNK